ncbi:MAG: T9SS type A sorting domain-containing protein [Calditrichaceae bacterium]|nr:T9SS type A sorting domain-containing protein [Calditrichia bacterium]NUQ44164.1 T9SS type A sorting domain-containing protein [Calditrichaceae bacterium]
MLSRSVSRWLTRLLIFFGCSFLLAQTYTPPPGSPLANHEHPRLFFTQASLQTIRNYINVHEAGNFQTYINAVDGAFNEAPSGKERNFLLLDATNYAFLSYAKASGLFSNYSFARSAEQYAAKAYDHAAEIAQRGLDEESHGNIFSSGGQGGYASLTLGAVYDWCYNYLTLSQKQVIADALITLYNQRDEDVNPGEYVKLGMSVLSQCHHVGVGGLALWGDPLGSQYTAIVQEMLNGIQWLWLDRILLMGDHMFEGTTGWSEGPDYFAGSSSHLIWYTAALSSAVNQNLFQDIHFLHDLPLYLYFYLFPMYVNGEEPGFYEQRNDAASLREWDNMGTLQQLYPVTSLIKSSDPTRAGFYRWIAEDSEYHFTTFSFDAAEPRLYWLFYKFLWGSKDVAKKTPAQAGIQTSYRFGLGEVILRSDLTTQNATKINFITPKYHITRHAHEDNTNFIIFKYGNLAVDAGVTKNHSTLPKSNETSTPVYHNILATYFPGQNIFYEYQTNTNDAADAYYDPDNQPGGANHVGDVAALRFEAGVFDYVDYDYTRAYKGEDYADRMRRKMLYIRDPNAPNYTNQEYLLFFDDADLNVPGIKRRWLLHTASAPELLDGSWNSAGNGFWTANSGATLKVSSTYANAHGRMFLKILAPNSYQLRLRGGNNGSSYYWFTDAEGNDLTERGPFSDWGAFWAGSHRLEVEDWSGGEDSQFLTVMQIGDANTLNAMAAVQKLETVRFVGAFINGNRVAFFNKTAAPGTWIGYNISTSQTVRHFITGLLPAQYQVKKDGALLQTIEVGNDGTLYFEHPGGGNFLIESGLSGVAPGDSPLQGFELEQNYPNPFNPTTAISYQLSALSNVELKIYDLNGRLVRTLVSENKAPGRYTAQWDAADNDGQPVASGLYYYRLRAGDFTETKKMIYLK